MGTASRHVDGVSQGAGHELGLTVDHQHPAAHHLERQVGQGGAGQRHAVTGTVHVATETGRQGASLFGIGGRHHRHPARLDHESRHLVGERTGRRFHRHHGRVREIRCLPEHGQYPAGGHGGRRPAGGRFYQRLDGQSKEGGIGVEGHEPPRRDGPGQHQVGADVGHDDEDRPRHEDLERVENGLREGGADGGPAHPLGGRDVAVGEDFFPAQSPQHPQADHRVRRQ